MDSRDRDRTDGYYSLTVPSTPKSKIIDAGSTFVNYSYPIQNNRDFHLPPHELGSVNFLNSREKSSERRRGNSSSGRRPRSRSSMFRDEIINGNFQYGTPTHSSFLRKRRSSESVASKIKNPRKLSSESSNDKEGFETNRIGPITLDYLRFFCKILTEEKEEKKKTGDTNEEREKDVNKVSQIQIGGDKEREINADIEEKDDDRARAEENKRPFIFVNLSPVLANKNAITTPNSTSRDEHLKNDGAFSNVFEESLPLFDVAQPLDEVKDEKSPDKINKAYTLHLFSPISRKSRINENQPRRAFSYLEKILNSHVSKHHRRSLQFIIDVQHSPDKRKLETISNDAEIERDVAFIIDDERTDVTDNGINIESFSQKLDDENNEMPQLEPDNAFEDAMERAEKMPEEFNLDFHSSSNDSEDDMRNSELPIEAEIAEDDIGPDTSTHEKKEPDFSDDNNFLTEGFTLQNYNESSLITDIEKEMSLLEESSRKKSRSRNDPARIPARRNKKALKKIVPNQTVKSLVKILEITNDLQGFNDKRKSGNKNYSKDVYQLIQEKSSEFILTVVSNLEAYSRHRTNSKSNQINIRDVLLYMKRVKEMEGLELDEPESLTRLAYKVLPLEFLLSLDNSLQLYTNKYLNQYPEGTLQYIED